MEAPRHEANAREALRELGRAHARIAELQARMPAAPRPLRPRPSRPRSTAPSGTGGTEETEDRAGGSPPAPGPVETAGELLEKVASGDVLNKPQAAGHALADRVLRGWRQ